MNTFAIRGAGLRDEKIILNALSHFEQYTLDHPYPEARAAWDAAHEALARSTRRAVMLLDEVESQHAMQGEAA